MSRSIQATKATIRKELEMARWTVFFDSTYTVSNIQAESEEEAERKAEEAVEEMDEVTGKRGECRSLRVYGIYLVRNEDTGEEIMKRKEANRNGAEVQAGEDDQEHLPVSGGAH
jgi:predicted RNase H-like HicB family nuclease